MTSWTMLWFEVVLVAGLAISQAHDNVPARSPKETVQEVWNMAVTGELLTDAGWNKASGLFAGPLPTGKNDPIKVVSNRWGPPTELKVADKKAEILVGCEDEGQIDAALKYTAPEKTNASKSGILYHLAYVQTHWRTYKSDGKTVDREMLGPMEWQIEDSPQTAWTTTNTAIRYVLEMRNKTSDPAIKKNADETLAKLLTLH